MGPWYHGGWRRPEGGGSRWWTAGTQTAVPPRVQAPWFAYWLKDKGTLSAGGVRSTTPGRSSGALRYLAAEGRGGAEPLLPRRRHGSRSTRPAADERPYDQYVSDPAHPVPYRLRPIEETYDRVARAGGLGDGGPALRRRPARRGQLGVRAARGRPHRRGRHHRAARGLDHRPRRRLGRSSSSTSFPTACRTSWRMGGYQLMVAARSCAGRYRKSFCGARADRAETAVAIHRGPAPAGLHVQARATGSWCRCRAPGFRSTTATRRPRCPTSSRRRHPTSGRRPTASGTRPGIRRASKSR